MYRQTSFIVLFLFVLLLLTISVLLMNLFWYTDLLLQYMKKKHLYVWRFRAILKGRKTRNKIIRKKKMASTWNWFMARSCGISSWKFTIECDAINLTQVVIYGSIYGLRETYVTHFSFHLLFTTLENLCCWYFKSHWFLFNSRADEDII